MSFQKRDIVLFGSKFDSGFFTKDKEAHFQGKHVSFLLLLFSRFSFFLVQWVSWDFDVCLAPKKTPNSAVTQKCLITLIFIDQTGEHISALWWMNESNKVFKVAFAPANVQYWQYTWKPTQWWLVNEVKRTYGTGWNMSSRVSSPEAGIKLGIYRFGSLACYRWALMLQHCL